VDAEVAVVGAGVVGCAVAMELSRRGASVVVFEAEAEPGLGASGTNSGILHTGFDSKPGELETELILRAATLRPPVLEALEIPNYRCGALLRPLREGHRAAVEALAANAKVNGVDVRLREDGSLFVPGETICDPVAFTLTMAALAQEEGVELLTHARVDSVARAGEGGGIVVGAGRERAQVRAVVNCAGLYADDVARAAGDDSFEVYPRKGEFLVFDLASDQRLERILLPVPEAGTKGVLVFPTLDGMTVCGPTAVDGTDKSDWSVRAEARDELIGKAAVMHPPLSGAEPVAAYAGLRPAGRSVNYVIGRSQAVPGLVNAAAIRSTGLTASLAIAERVCEEVAALGLELDRPWKLHPVEADVDRGPWWRRTARYRSESPPE
jgi:glycerol-3-phosphate dehydrogenase